MPRWMPQRTDLDWSRVDKAGPDHAGAPCWLWTGPVQNRGYGFIWVLGVRWLAPPIAAWAIGKPIVNVRWFYEVKKKARRYETLEVA
jgi:hypothetical protein